MSDTSISRYRESQITSATPEETVLMLYDGAIRFLSTAIKEVEENSNIPGKSILLEKTVKIIDYLQSCLDSEKGEIIARNLNSLYDYMVIELTKANLRNDTAKMQEILGLLITIRDGWNGICDKNSGNGKMQQPEINAGLYSSGDIEEAETPQPESKIAIKV